MVLVVRVMLVVEGGRLGVDDHAAAAVHPRGRLRGWGRAGAIVDGLRADQVEGGVGGGEGGQHERLLGQCGDTRPGQHQCRPPRLAAAGHQVRVYVPYGSDWYGYLMRRLAERPANLAFFLRALWPR